MGRSKKNSSKNSRKRRRTKKKNSCLKNRGKRKKNSSNKKIDSKNDTGKSENKININLTSKKISPNLSLQRNSKFLVYEQIIELLQNLSELYASNLQLKCIGESTEGRSIYLAIITGNQGRFPKNGVFIEAGSDGEDWMAITSALYMIEYLAKNAACNKNLKIMDYFIVPCSNPDSYQNTIIGEEPCMNLSTNFPFRLGKLNSDKICMSHFLRSAKTWKETYKNNCPEKVAILNAINAYQFVIKLFISLQEKGKMILYSYGVTDCQVDDIKNIRKVALAGRSENTMCLKVGSIYQRCGLTFGTIIDFLNMFQNSLRFSYIIHMNRRKRRRDEDCIPQLAHDLLSSIKSMSQKVCEFYKDHSKDKCTNNKKRAHKKDEIPESKCL